MFTSISHTDKLAFTKHLRSFIKAGIPLKEAISDLQDSSKSSSFRQILNQINKMLDDGHTMSEALAKYPHTFNQFYRSMIAVGESSGTLEDSLNYLIKHLKKSHALKQKLQGALMYPALVFTAIFIMGSVISLFVLPQLVEFFDAFDFPLPLSTKILLAFANFSKRFGILSLSIFILTFFSITILIRTKAIKPVWHRFLLGLPFFKYVITYKELSEICRNLNILLKSGEPLKPALQTTGNSTTNLVFRRQLHRLEHQLNQGKSLAEALGSKTFTVFPPVFIKIVRAGEKTGSLESSFEDLAEFFEDELDQTTKNLTTLLEPALLLFVGVIVAFVALAIISPIYELTGSIRR